MAEFIISEFNHKLLHGILNDNVSVNKWNKDVSLLYHLCVTFVKQKKTQSIFFTMTVKLLNLFCRKLVFFSKFDIAWNIIVLGYYHDTNEQNGH